MRHERLLVAVGLCSVALLGPISAEQQPTQPDGHPERFEIGEPASVTIIERLDIDIRPDGSGLPNGSGTAMLGATIYAERCASCHGGDGEGGTANRLVTDGAVGSGPAAIGNYWPYATTLFDYIRRAMPTNAPGSLTDDEVYSLTAWLLSANGVIDGGAPLDAEALVEVRMPAQDIFVPDNRLESNAVR